MALRCSTLLMPNLLSFGATCSKEGSQLSKSASNCNVGWDFMLLIVESDRVGQWRGMEKEGALFRQVSTLYTAADHALQYSLLIILSCPTFDLSRRLRKNSLSQC